MAGKQISGEGLSSSMAGMSKNQLYDIMSQMKACPFLFRLSGFFPFPSVVSLASQWDFFILFNFVSFLFLSRKACHMFLQNLYSRLYHLQTLIEQNQQQARQILIQNPALTKALFQVWLLIRLSASLNSWNLFHFFFFFLCIILLVRKFFSFMVVIRALLRSIWQLLISWLLLFCGVLSVFFLPLFV